MVIRSIGAAEVELRYSGVRRTRLEMGDMLYIPAGTPSRIVPLEESIHLREPSPHPGREGHEED
jgi:3-hydroxyanthranilate 3,4-dioxygenase